MRFEAERAREQLQRQLAAAEGRAGVLQTRVDDVLADNRALRHKVCRRHPLKAMTYRGLLWIVCERPVVHCEASC